jgi:hypothetical protein
VSRKKEDFATTYKQSKALHNADYDNESHIGYWLGMDAIYTCAESEEDVVHTIFYEQLPPFRKELMKCLYKAYVIGEQKQ